MSQRVVIETLVFAREARVLQGELPIAALARTLDSLVDTAGSVAYRVEGRMSERKRPRLLLHIEGVSSLRCQRCLEGVEYPLQVRNVLEFVDDEEALTQEEIEDDSRDFLPMQHEVDVVALLEDEIILALPPAPRHESCALPGPKQETANLSPFSVLKGLKGKTT